MTQLAITLGEVAGAATTPPLQAIRGLPFGGITEVDTGWTLLAVDGSNPIIAQRFPVPQIAIAYLGYEAEFYNFENPFSFPPFPMEGLAPAPLTLPWGTSGQPISGAMVQEGIYTEPTVGQIWPRLA